MFEELTKRPLTEIAQETGYFTRENVAEKELPNFLKVLTGLLRVIREDFEEDSFLEEVAIYDYRIFYITDFL